MSDSPPYDEIGMLRGHPSCYVDKLDDILNTPHNSNFAYFLQVDLSCPDEIKDKTKKIPFAPEIGPQAKFSKPVKYIKPSICRKNEKLVCD